MLQYRQQRTQPQVIQDTSLKSDPARQKDLLGSTVPDVMHFDSELLPKPEEIDFRSQAEQMMVASNYERRENVELQPQML